MSITDIANRTLGVLRLEITSADIAGILTALHQRMIVLNEIQYVNELTVVLTVGRNSIRKIERCVERYGGHMHVLERKGIGWRFSAVKNRLIFLSFLVILIGLSIFLPTRILFVRVEGNVAIPTNYILNEAQNNGIHFGASSREIRSEQVKNALLEKIPQLSWVGINTRGFVATISVKEKVVAIEEEEPFAISSIVASRDGVIQELTVTEGYAFCKSGQAVKAGQVLISGYQDLGILIRATQAQGQITAKTKHKIQAVCLTSSLSRGEELYRQKKYMLIIGKKQINLYKDSGISDSSCVKIYEKAEFVLPGGFALPVALVTEEWIYYDPSAYAASENSFDWLDDYVRRYVKDQMVSGSVLEGNFSMKFDAGTCIFTGTYACLEEIGRVKKEEIIQKYGENG